MLEFDFTVNKSFLNAKYGHPITVPSSQVDYSELRKQELHEGELTIIFPRDERTCGRMHSSKAGYGQYYQIRVNKKSVPEYLREGEEVKVSLFSDSSSKYATIEYTKSEI